MKNWKPDLASDKDHKEMKMMYAKVDEILKTKILSKLANELEPLKKG